MHTRKCRLALIPHRSKIEVSYIDGQRSRGGPEPKGKLTMEKLENLLDGTVVILLGLVTAGLLNALPAVL
jgi:hypothetical protein